MSVIVECSYSIKCSNNEASPTPKTAQKLGVSVYKTKSYEVLVTDAANSLACALDEGKTRVVIDFPVFKLFPVEVYFWQFTHFKWLKSRTSPCASELEIPEEHETGSENGAGFELEILKGNMPRDKTDKAFKGQNSKGKNIRSESEAAIEVITLSDSDDDSSRTISDTPTGIIGSLQHLTHKSVANNKKSVHADDADSGRISENIKKPKFDCPKVNSDKHVDPKPRLFTDAEDEVEDGLNDDITLTSLSKRKIGKSNIHNNKKLSKAKKARFDDEPETSNCGAHGLGGSEPSGSGVVRAGRVKKQKAFELKEPKPSKRGHEIARREPAIKPYGPGHEIVRPKPVVPVIGQYGSGLTVSQTGSVLAMALGKPMDQVLEPFGSTSTVSRTGSAKPMSREIRPFGSGLGPAMALAKPIAHEVRPFGSGLGIETGQANPTAHEGGPIGSGFGVETGRANPTGPVVGPIGSGLDIETGRVVRPIGPSVEIGQPEPMETVCSLNQNPADFSTQMAKEYRRKF